MRLATYFCIIFLIALFVNTSYLFAQNSLDTINSQIDSVYSPSNFTTYQINDRYSDPFSSLFSNNAYNLNTSLLRLSSKYDTSRVFYLEEKLGSLNYRPSIAIPFNSYDKFNTKKQVKEYFRDKSLSLDGESTLKSSRLIPKIYIPESLDLSLIHI